MKVTAVVILLLSLLGIFWFVKTETAPKPGIAIPYMGNAHVPDSTPVSYNSNPPTSGPHNDSPQKEGIYDMPLNDRKLVHSLEHGFVIISYNCEYKKTGDDPNCQQLVSELSSLANKEKIWKLIVVPRPSLDNRLALTAWTRLDKFYDFDEKRIVAFIDAFRDHGPEQTPD